MTNPIQPKTTVTIAANTVKETKMDALRNQLLQQVKPEIQAGSHNWSQLTRGGEQRKILLSELKAKEFGSEDLDELKSLRQVVQNKLDGKVEGSNLVQRVFKAIRNVFANIISSRNQELEHIKELLNEKIIPLNKPVQLGKLIEHFQNTPSLQNVEGIFRLSGSTTKINEWISNPNATIEDLKDPHDVSGSLRKLVGEQFAGKQELINGLRMCFNGNDLDYTKAGHFRDTLYDLYPFTKELLQMLHSVSLHSEENKMGSTNLATCMAPNLFQADPLRDVEILRMGNSLLEAIIRCPVAGTPVEEPPKKAS